MLSIEVAALGDLPDRIGRADAPLVVMPFIDAAQARQSAAQLARRAGVEGVLLCVHDAERRGFIAAQNAVFRRADAPYVAYVAQDAFAGRDWLATGMTTIARNDGGLLAFNDGKWGGALAAFGLVASPWARGLYDGDLFHPAYNRHYADVELTLVAMQQRRLRYSADALLIEVDWEKDGRAINHDDRVTFHRRNQTAFDRKVLDPGLRRLFK
jgi:hypothetical protein